MELEPSAKPTTLSPHNLTSYAHDYHQTGHLTDHHHTDHLIAEYTTETAVATPQCRVDAIQTTTSSDTSPYTSPYTSLESSSEIAAAERPLQPGGAAEDLTGRRLMLLKGRCNLEVLLKTSLMCRSLILSALSSVGGLATHLVACVLAYASLSSYQQVCYSMFESKIRCLSAYSQLTLYSLNVVACLFR